MIEVRSGPLRRDVIVRVPGSKSYTHRLLVAAALARGRSAIRGALRSEDTLATLDALKKLGVGVDDDGDSIFLEGRAGRFAACSEPIFLANSGTSMRLLGSLAALGEGRYVLDGCERMRERPMRPLLEALCAIGIEAKALNGDGCPPLELRSGKRTGGSARVDCGTSSQYLSSLLMIAPCLEKGLSLEVSRGPVSRPYIDMTLETMGAFGISHEREGYDFFRVAGGQGYRSGEHRVEADASQAGYFWAAGAVTGARVKVEGVLASSLQGDARLARVFERMGCRVERESDGIAVRGPAIAAVDEDMGDMPDMVPTLAVVAAFAHGTTRMRNVSHLRAKESDRLAAIIGELAKMGIEAGVESRDGEEELFVVGGEPHGARIETYRDHRIAMSFAVAGLAAPGTTIDGEACVGKSFPDFWSVFGGLYA